LEDFIFIKGRVPDGFKVVYEISLFNSNEHRLLQSNGDWLSYYIINGKKKIAVAGIHFLVSNGLASSPYRSPFGSIDASPDLNPSVLFLFLQFIESDLLKSDVKSIVIKNPPTLYNPELQSLLQVFLSNLGYQSLGWTSPARTFLQIGRDGKLNRHTTKVLSCAMKKYPN
jgi:hypothetical protein